MRFFQLSKQAALFIIVLFVTIDLALLHLFLQSSKASTLLQSQIDQNSFIEVEELRGNQKTFQELYDYFKNLAHNKGGEYAFEILKRADMPKDTDLHLLGHVVGDVLYKQKGVEGIQVCTQDFRNACSHSIVVGTLLEKGPEALQEISDTCRRAPGGKGAYTMCFHGLGHGVLAYTDYELPDAVELCKKTGTAAYNNQESSECIGGIIMEIISGGDHDKTLWEQKNKKYLTSKDPLYPCTASYMPKEALNMCYTYLTPHLFNRVGADWGAITESDIEKSFAYCKLVPSNQLESRKMCFAGFGKEFVVLAQARDIRIIDQMTDEQFGVVNRWCSLAHDEVGRTECIKSALSSIYWGGENNRSAAIRYCNTQLIKGDKSICFSELVSSVQYYIDDKNYRKTFCQEIPTEQQLNCRQMLEI